MKNFTLFFVIILLTGIPCRTQQAPVGQREAANENTSRERKQYQQESEAKLRELDREIDTLNTRAAKRGKEARRDLNREMDELDRKRDVTRQQIESLKKSSQGAWRDMKPGIDAAMNDLEVAYKRAASHFK